MPSKNRQERLVDFNILPEQYRPRKLPSRVLFLWLAAIGLTLLLVPTFLVSARVRANTAQVEEELEIVRQELQIIPTPVGEVIELTLTLSETNGALQRLEEALPSIMGRSDWPEIMTAIDDYDGSRLEVDSVTQVENEITLVGQAIDSASVIGYVDSLKASHVFENVSLLSMDEIAVPYGTITVTPTATSTVTPTLTPSITLTPTATLSPTPDLADAYEVDDVVPVPIGLGEQQLRNFYPVNDVDKVLFLAKAGRIYHVFTSKLVSGVDTYLTVRAGSIVYTNDDCYTSEGEMIPTVCYKSPDNPQASLIEFRLEQDMQVTITVDNRGEYGPDQWYVLTVEDTGAQEDDYEDDDRVPKPIAIAEDQLHNFYPDGDIDKVQFLVKQGNEYEITTSGLSAGVDTYMSVAVDGRIYYDDDGGDEPLSSRVRFMALNEGVAVATITNKGRFGSDRWYHVILASLEPTPIPVDEYEVDDVVPVPIVLDEPQQRNFYPLYDVDRVQFLAKAGRIYRVFTSGLARGVDTYLTVRAGATVLTNDDCYTSEGQLSYSDCGDSPDEASLIEFGFDQDKNVSVTVDNRGEYGPEQTYLLTLQDTGAQEDEYEDDDNSPKPIAIGEEQRHNFFPDGDIDKVQFLVKQGNEYEIITTGLSDGVDTYLSVAVDGRVYTDDDGGDEPLWSRVRFMALNEGVAVATITNKGRFGSNSEYDVSVEEIEPVDEYEVDDVVPAPIFVGQVQIHNFYPQLDVDKVQLRIKGGRVYEVYTYGPASPYGDQPNPNPPCPAPLPPGVDTTIQVEGWGMTCEPPGCFNDDWTDYGWTDYGYCLPPLPADYSSRVKFWAPNDVDVVITVRSSNNQYGPEMYYALYVWDLGHYATETPTVTPTATTPPTSTLTPTATTPPTDTLTPTATTTPTHTLTPTATHTVPLPPTNTPPSPYTSSASGLGLMAPIPRSTEEAEGLIQVGLGYSRPPGLASALDTGRNRMGRSLAPVQANAVEFVILLTLKAIVP